MVEVFVDGGTLALVREGAGGTGRRKDAGGPALSDGLLRRSSPVLDAVYVSLGQWVSVSVRGAV